MPAESALGKAAAPSEIVTGIRDALPFVFSLLLTFTLIGMLGRRHGLDLPAMVVFSGTVMASPLQLTLLETPAHLLNAFGVLVSALSINLRFLVFTLSLKSSLEGPIKTFVPALAVMANAAFTLMSIRKEQQPISRAYANTVCFLLYAAALFGTMAGYCFASLADNAVMDHVSVVIAIFISASLGKMARDRHSFHAQWIAGLATAAGLLWLGEVSLLLVLVVTVLTSYAYDRT
ncbi:AzlC family ABC transporter permease [Pseudomonas sp. efr-133-TYG-5]|jgi:predicted branched-subunit amino acid permease|uniref:AzlC family ABC transporter permease n=1 Tax=Pseudomonas sp. efr-133-TYG-5 TaxID=3040310 RepID=UPI0025551A39|nr:AzlC family ABC transporter permease [Pseudomonas sp. efr-133-TYG-5]